MKHQPILYAFCAALALYPITLLVLHFETNGPPGYGWSGFASAWGAIIGGILALFAAGGTILTMRYQTEKNIEAVRRQTRKTVKATGKQTKALRKQTKKLREIDDRRSALDYAAYLRTVASELHSLSQNFASNVSIGFSLASAINNDLSIVLAAAEAIKIAKGTDVTSDDQSVFLFEAKTRAYAKRYDNVGIVERVHPPNIGHLPHDIRKFCSRAFDRFNIQANVQNTPDVAFMGIVEEPNQTVNVNASAELRLNWSIALMEAAAILIEKRQAVQVGADEIVNVAGNYVGAGNLPLILPNLFRKYEISPDWDVVDKGLAAKFGVQVVDFDLTKKS